MDTYKQYIGQTVTHRKNNNKYRFHGYIGRFNDHISEAIRNTRKDGACSYLNCAIRKYGKERFTVEIVELCLPEDLDDREKLYIKLYNTLSPNGYNLTTGGKGNIQWIQADTQLDEKGVRIPLKKGREFGYVHKKETINKMRQYYEEHFKDPNNKLQKSITMRNSISNYFNDNRAIKLANLDFKFDQDFAKYIRPHRKNNIIIGYVIRINRCKYARISNKDISKSDQYKMLYNSLEKAYNIQQTKLKPQVN
jgi:hypothetical protein